MVLTDEMGNARKKEKEWGEVGDGGLRTSETTCSTISSSGILLYSVKIPRIKGGISGVPVA